MTFDDLLRVLLLQEYNTRLVVVSTAILGVSSGIVGTFLLLRRRSLMADALSHATLPGVAIAFLLMVAMGGSGKWMPGLLMGALVFGLLGATTVTAIARLTRLKDDAAMAIVLGSMFGLGVALLGVISDVPGASAAGLQHFIVGHAASMIAQDSWLIVGGAVCVATAVALLYKELLITTFDPEFARSQGWPVATIDFLLIAMVAVMTVIGMQAVGLILMVALFVLPPTAARFWTDNMIAMLIISALIGGVGAWCGASVSALIPNMPAGAIIVLACAGVFMISLLAGTRRGVIRRAISAIALAGRIARQHLLRGMYEQIELQDRINQATNTPVKIAALLPIRSWSSAQLGRLLGRAQRAGLLQRIDRDTVQFTEAGIAAAARTTRNHRLWEMYLITHADIAPSHVDRDADQIEHVLDANLLRILEASLDLDDDMIQSPHALGNDAA
ncbi:MAG: iron chelate uptake ABC transporter family permease subunit [Phycisphaerales bacterium]